MGFPIRRSSDHSSFAAPQGLSQRTTSFIASQRQGIHQMLFRHLIALMIHARRKAIGNTPNPAAVDQKDRSWIAPGTCLPNTTGPDGPSKGRSWCRGQSPNRSCSLFTMSNTRPRPLRPRANCSLTPDVSRERRRGSWWSQTGSNRRPHACKARALPTELWPHLGGPREDADSAIGGGPGTTRTSDLTLIRGAL